MTYIAQSACGVREAASNVKRTTLRGGTAALAVALTTLATALTAEERSPDQVLWRSNNSTLEELSEQQTELYVTLYNIGKLPVKSYRVEDERDIEQLLRDGQLFHGEGFPDELDSLLCDLNRHACSRALSVATEESLQDFAAHVGGYMPSGTEWLSLKGLTVILPDFNFEYGFSIQPFYKRTDQSLEQIVLEERRGCWLFNEMCQDLLAFLNRRVPGFDSPAYEGEIETPVLSLATVVDLNCAAGECRGVAEPDGFEAGVPADRDRASNPSTRGRDQQARDEVAAEEEEKQLAERDALRRLNDNLASAMRFIRTQSTPAYEDEPYFNSQFRLFDFINFPWVSESTPPEFQNAVRVAVIDEGFDPTHCDLPHGKQLAFWRITDTGGDLQAVEASQEACVKQVENEGSAEHHANHTLGIIAAQLNGHGVVGVNPEADLTAIEVKWTDLGSPEYQATFVRSVFADIYRREPPHVVNVSFKYQPGRVADSLGIVAQTDFLQEEIKGLKKHTLFVAAAGQDDRQASGRDLSNFCDVYPACLNAPNVISVVALGGNRSNPKVMKGAHFGAQLDIGALGEAVVSTGVDDRFVSMHGSSQAAPQVAAVASLLFAFEQERLAPVEVKNRIMACAEPIEALEGKVLAGRLDAGCVLDKPDRGRFVLRDGRIIYGQQKRVTHGSPARVVDVLELEYPGGEQIAIPWRNVYALRCPPHRADCVVFTYRSSNDHEVPLERRAGLFMSEAALQTQMSVNTADGETIDLDLSQLQDYIVPVD